MAQNKPQTEDLRVRRTRKLLMEAMIALTIEQGFAAITVQEIVDRAMINRATFYRHYLDKYDLLEKYMDEVYALTAAEDAFAAGPTQDARSESERLPVGMVSMLEHVQRQAAFYRAMLGKQGDPAFVQRMQQYSEKRLRSLLPGPETQTKPSDPPLDLCLRYLSHAGIGVIAWWLSEGQSSTPEQVALWLNQLNKATLDLVMARPGLPDREANA